MNSQSVAGVFRSYNTIMLRLILLVILFVVFPAFVVPTMVQATTGKDSLDYSDADSNKIRMNRMMDMANLKPKNPEYFTMIVQNIDIKNYPVVSLIIEAIKTNGQPLDTIYADDLTLLESGKQQKILSIKKISINQVLPIDFVFVIDVTGTMQKYIDETRNNIEKFTQAIKQRGVDCRLGLITYSDNVEQVYQPTDNIKTFLAWLSFLKAAGGMDEKENALEALYATSRIQFRPSANKVIIIITDAPYHQRGEVNGNGKTNYTTKSMKEYLKKNDLRLFSISPLPLKEYDTLTSSSRGSVFDIRVPFANILAQYAMQLTNLFAISYVTAQPAIPDSINVAIVNSSGNELLRKTIPVLEIQRKLIIENLLFPTGSNVLPDSVKELEVLHQFMVNRKGVRILIEGHTDNIGSDRSNLILSDKRAKAVKDYLVRKGVEPNRISTKGFGKSKPITTNATEFGRRLNRRTEIIITETGR